jgi:hypothetical protein
MPILDPTIAAALRGAETSAEQELDLRALARAEAEARLAATLAAARPASTTLLVRLDPATPTSGETLFLPIGRALLAARQAGRVLRFAPLPESAGAGFHATLPARAA